VPLPSAGLKDKSIVTKSMNAQMDQVRLPPFLDWMLVSCWGVGAVLRSRSMRSIATQLRVRR